MRACVTAVKICRKPIKIRRGYIPASVYNRARTYTQQDNTWRLQHAHLSKLKNNADAYEYTRN